MSQAGARDTLAPVRHALLFGNFVIGSGVMAVVGVLNDLSRSLDVSVATGGQLIAVAAAVMCFGAPLLAGWIGGFDRRRLLAGALLWYAVGHAACALLTSYEALWPVRAATVLGAAVFTPQAAAAIGVMAPPAERGRAIMTIFIGWSAASVIGVPMASWVGESYGWRSSFAVIALLGAAGAIWVYRVMPDGVRPPTLSLGDWKGLLSSPFLMGMVAVTALSGAGQFTLFSYLAPYYKQALQASAAEIGLLFWPLGNGLASAALVLIPWGLGCFSSNSAQQARLGRAAPALAPALMALNSSAIYLGQAAGASSGGWTIEHGGYAPLHWIGAAWMGAAITLSVWVGRRAAVRAA